MITKNITCRQAEIISLVAHGFLNKEIAWKLKKTENSIHSSIVNTNYKTGCRSRYEIVRYWDNISIEKACMLLGGFS